MVTDPETVPLIVLLATDLVATACLAAAAARMRPIAPLRAVDAATITVCALDAVTGVFGPECSGTEAVPEPVELLLPHPTAKLVRARTDAHNLNLFPIYYLRERLLCAVSIKVLFAEARHLGNHSGMSEKYAKIRPGIQVFLTV